MPRKTGAFPQGGVKLHSSPIKFQDLYRIFDASITVMDCGLKCAPYHPNGIPFCCDICYAVPVAYHQEWQYLQQSTKLWHLWRGDECEHEPTDQSQLLEQTPPHLCLLACLGPSACERQNRSISCRQFPFFPYFTPDYRFIGMTYDWEFSDKCWVINNLALVTSAFRQEFFTTFDRIFDTWLEDMDSYIELAAETREHYRAIHRRIPLLHRNGLDYLVSPVNGRLYPITAGQFPRFAPYNSSPTDTGA